MDSSGNCTQFNVTSGSLSTRNLRSSLTAKLLGTASAVVCAFALANSAAAQTVPAECDVVPNPLASGSTILCVAPGMIVGQVSSPIGVDDLTVVVGDEVTPTTLNSGAAANAVQIAGSGDQTLAVVNAGSAVIGSVTGAVVEVAGGSGALTINSEGVIAGGANGIDANNYGLGVTSITTADVQGGLGRGINVNGYGGDIAVDTTSGTVTGGTHGIYVDQFGEGDISITTADVIGGSEAGIYAFVGSGGEGDIVIDSTAGSIMGQRYGIYVDNNGAGGVSITTADVIGVGRTSPYYHGVYGGDGIYVDNGWNSIGGVTINTVAGSVTGFDNGINVENNGPGATSITTADVHGGVGRGIDVDADGGDVVVDTTAGTVTGGTYGIYVDQFGEGGISITAADVVGGSEAGIYAFTGGSSQGDIVIDSTAGSVVGQQNGIYVNNNGSGGVSITTADVNSTGRTYYSHWGPYTDGGDGIYVDNDWNSTGDVTINTVAGSVTGFDDGIDVDNRGHGSVHITTADVTGLTSDGIEVSSGNDWYYGEGYSGEVQGGDIVINTVAGSVVGEDDGMDISNYGRGSVTITAANVTGIYGDGINVDNSSNSLGGVTIDTTAGTVAGGYNGISVNNDGLGGVTITTADVTAHGEIYYYEDWGPRVYGGEAIAVRNRSNSAGGVTIDTVAGAVTGLDGGILVENSGADGINITTADVSGGESYGIGAFNTPYSQGGIAINTVAGTVSGEAGIYAANMGAGGIAITTADVSGDFIGVAAINGTNFNSHYGETTPMGGIAIDTSAGAVTGGLIGVGAINGGRGSIDITTADVSGYTGIYAMNLANSNGGIAIDTTAGAVTGGEAGIVAQNAGEGGIQITTADVTATGGYYSGEAYSPFSGAAIAATNYGTAGGIAIDTTRGTIAGSTVGIIARNEGAAGIDITTADVSGNAGGVIALNGANYYGYGEGIPLGGVSVDTSAGAVSGGMVGVAVLNAGMGSIEITTGEVTGGGAGIVAQNAYNSAGGIIIDSTAGTVSAGAEAIAATNMGRGGISITTAAVSSTYGGAILAVNSAYSAGDLIINTAAGEVAVYSDSIRAINNGSGGISITAADVTSSTGGGIFAYNSETSEGTLEIDTAAGAVNADLTGIGAIAAAGDVAITTGDVSSANATAILAQGAGNVLVDTTAGTVTGAGAYSDGISAISMGGDVSVTVADVTGGANGINALSSNGSVVVDGSAGTVAGLGNGIAARSLAGGDVVVTAAGVVASGDAYSTAITALAVEGDLSVHLVDNANVSGDYIGVDARTIAPNATLTLAGNGTGTLAGGAYGARLAGSGGDIVVTNLGTVTASGGDALNLQTAGGDAAITSLVSATGTGGNGVLIATNGGTINLAGLGTVVGTAGDGVLADATGGAGGSVVVGPLAAGSVISGSDDGIDARTDGAGTIALSTAAGRVTGGNNGIEATSLGTGGIAITAGHVTGTGNAGILATSANGPIAVRLTAGTAVTGGGNAGIVATSAGATGAVTLNGAGSVVGATDGIVVATTGAPIAVSGLASVTGNAGNGVDLTSAGGDISIAGLGTVLGNGGHGILLTPAGGSVSVQDSGLTGGITGTGGAGISVATATASGGGISLGGTAALGDVSGSTFGIEVANTGSGAISIGAANVTGGSEAGISVRNTANEGGNIAIATSGTATGNGAGILASNAGAGASLAVTANNVTGTGTGAAGVNVSGAGPVSVATSGLVQADGAGVLALSAAGPVTVAANNVTAGTGPAILAEVRAGGAGDVLVDASGTVVGGSAGISIRNLGSGASTVNNAGTLSAMAGAAIAATGSGVAINNSGTVTGFVSLTANDDVFNNTGRFNVTATSDFGAGTDVFNNTGTLFVPAQLIVSRARIAAEALQPAFTLTGLETFNNSGLVDLRNGEVGTQLVLPGNYAGSGNATVGLDIALGASGAVSDVLVIEGAATGSTKLALNVLSTSSDVVGFDNLLLVDAGAGSSATAFTIASGFEEQGLLQIGITFDVAGNDYRLVAGPATATYRTGLYAEGARNLWHRTADGWTRHLASVRDAGMEPGRAVWGFAMGEISERDSMQTFSFNSVDRTYDLGYAQDYVGAQFGVDLGGAGGFTYGATAGYLASNQKFNGSNDRVKYDAVNIGAYAGFKTGIFFGNLLGKYDHVWADARSADANFAEDLDGSVYGARAEVGFTLTDPASGAFAEPTASLSYVKSDLDGFETGQGAIEFNEDEGLLGKIGGRFGIGEPAGRIYFGGNLVHEFKGNDGVVFRNRGQAFAFENSAESDYAEVMMGLNIASPDRKVSGAFEARYSDGGDHRGLGGSATVTFQF